MDLTLLNDIRLYVAEVLQSIANGELQGKDAEAYKSQGENLMARIDKAIGDV